jgi:hypothetical protein
MVKLFGCLDPRVVAMLAEIFMLRLEATARLMDKTLPSSTSPFVPFSPKPQFAPKEIGHAPTEAKMEERSLPLVG